MTKKANFLSIPDILVILKKLACDVKFLQEQECECSGENIDQNNIDIFKTLYIPTPEEGDLTLELIAEYANALPTYTVDEHESVWFIVHEYGISRNNPTAKRHIYKVSDVGKGTYGAEIGSSFITADFLKHISTLNLVLEDILNSPNTQIISFPDLENATYSTISDYLNTQQSVVLQSQLVGYRLFRTPDADFLFLGEGGEYGINSLQSLETDFQLVSTNSNTDVLNMLVSVELQNLPVASWAEVTIPMVTQYIKDLGIDIHNGEDYHFEIKDNKIRRVYKLLKFPEGNTSEIVEDNVWLESESQLSSVVEEVIPPGLIIVTETGKTGYRLALANANNHGDIGTSAVDLSYQPVGNIGYGALGTASYAQNYLTTASGNYSHSEGWSNTATGVASHVEGNQCLASGNFSHAEGHISTSVGQASHAGGINNTSNIYGETVVGVYAEIVTGSPNTNIPTDSVFRIGTGQSNVLRKDGFKLLKNGLALLPAVTNALIEADETNKAVVTKEYLLEWGDNNTTTQSLGDLVNSATNKATPIDADMIPLMDSAASNIIKKLSWANIKATLKTYFDTLYGSKVSVIRDLNIKPVVTGNLAYNIIETYTIPANTFNATDAAELTLIGKRLNPVGNALMAVHLNGSGVGDRIASVTISATNVYSPLKRISMKFEGGKLKIAGISTGPQPLQLNSDMNAATTAYIEIDFNPTIANTLTTTILLGDITNQYYQEMFILKKA